jgi:hypothetical protein
VLRAQGLGVYEAVEAGKFERARFLMRVWRPFVLVLKPTMLADFTHWEGRIALAQGKHARACTRFAAAADEYKFFGHPDGAVFMGQLLRAHGCRPHVAT